MRPIWHPALSALSAMSIPSIRCCTCADTCACATNVHWNNGKASVVAIALYVGPSYVTSSAHTSHNNHKQMQAFAHRDMKPKNKLKNHNNLSQCDIKITQIDDLNSHNLIIMFMEKLLFASEFWNYNVLFAHTYTITDNSITSQWKQKLEFKFWKKNKWIKIFTHAKRRNQIIVIMTSFRV